MNIVGFMLTVHTIVKSIVGTTVVSLPYAMARMGYVLGTIVFIFGTLLSHFGSILLLKSKNLSKKSKYSSIFYEIWESKKAKGISLLIIGVGQMGVCTSFWYIGIAQFIILKMTIRKMFLDTHQEKAYDFFTQKYFILSIVALLEILLITAPKI